MEKYKLFIDLNSCHKEKRKELGMDQFEYVLNPTDLSPDVQPNLTLTHNISPTQQLADQLVATNKNWAKTN